MLHWTPSDIERFLGYIEILPSGCWFWRGARSRGEGNRKFYGSFRLGRRTVRAHRFSCDVVGKICPPGHDRDHTCCFSLCVNPDHIEIVPKTINSDRRKESHSARRESENAARARLGLAPPPARTRRGRHTPAAHRLPGGHRGEPRGAETPDRERDRHKAGPPRPDRPGARLLSHSAELHP